MTDYSIRPAATVDPFELIRSRLRSLGLFVWRVDLSGLPLSEPQVDGLLGLFLTSSFMRQRLRQTVEAWKGEAPAFCELFPGCWIVPVAESNRQLTIGYSIAMAFSAEAREAPELIEGCKSANIDPSPMRRVLMDHDWGGAGPIERVASFASWMVEDSLGNQSSSKVIGGFTTELTDAYETIDVLYTLGGSMHNVRQPEHFLRMSMNTVLTAMQFRWLAMVVLEEPDVPKSLRGETLVFGEMQCPAGDARSALLETIRKASEFPECQIFDETENRFGSHCTQLMVHPIMHDGRMVAAFVAGDKRGEDPQISSYDTHLVESAIGYMASYLETATLYEKQQAMFLGTLHALTAAIDAKDPYTCGHSERVAYLSSHLALAVGYTPEEAERVDIAGLVHDVGKIGVPEAVLGKNGRLTDEEFEQIKRHPQVGYDILRGIPLLQDVLPGVLHHHERWDGRGYPAKIGGQEIPQIARIICLADTFDAMSSNRSYRAAMPREKVFEEFRKCAGTQFDPDLVGPFLDLDFSAFDEMISQAASQRAA